MTLTLDDLDFLTSERGNQLLHSLAGEDLSQQHSLKLITRYRQTYTRQEVGAALLTAQCRQKAIFKFGSDAAVMFFTDSALQQASDPLVRQYRTRVTHATTIVDMCCGIGTDSIAFARAGANSTGYDIDPVRVRIAQINASRLGLTTTTFHQKDVTSVSPDDLQDYELIFFDPARRDEQGRRIYHVERYIPPLSLMRNWPAHPFMVKLSPGVDTSQIAPYGGEVQFISVDGDMKEALLLTGDDHTGMCAILLQGDDTYQWRRQGSEPDVSLGEPEGWLCEPDPSILRAELVKDVVSEYAGLMLDHTIAYFTTRTRIESVWLRAWEIRDWMRFNLKKLRAYLNQHHIGHVTVKKRGSPIEPEHLIRKLKLKGSNSCTLILTRLHGSPIVIICADA